MKKHLTIVSCAPELSPFAKSGGLGDVAIALPKHLLQLGHEVIAILPMYSFLKRRSGEFTKVGEDVIRIGYKKYPVKYYTTTFEGLPVYFAWNEELFSSAKMYGCDNDNLRFYFFDLACLQLIEKLNVKPDIIHCHDWHTGLIPNLLAIHHAHDGRFAKTATVFTIHNLIFQRQGNWWVSNDDQQDNGKTAPSTSLREIRKMNFTVRGIRFATVINTVSERYAQEILTPAFGQGLDGLLRKRADDVYGIINGIDYSVFNPAFDNAIECNYDWRSLDNKRRCKTALQHEAGLEPKADIPLLGMVHRLSEQKGIHLMMGLMPTLLKLPLQICVVGSGEKDYVKFFKSVSHKHPKKVGVMTHFTDASKVYAGSDMFLMPSRFEPCGISQMISLRYGSVPVVHETGGLSDTITNFTPRAKRGNGFVFSTYTREDFLVAIVRALETYRYPDVWKRLTVQGMRQSYSWEIPTKKYVQLYRRALTKKNRR